MTLLLKEVKPFAQGGNRLCFVHPDNPDRCIKVRRPDFTLADCRRKKGFPKKLRPLSSFDDNREEYQTIQQLQCWIGDSIFDHVYLCFGFVDTDFGPGLETELIRDADGLISLSLKQYLWEVGYTEQCRQAINELTTFWRAQKVPSRDLLTHNIVVQRDPQGAISRLVVIDGLGDPTLIPFRWLPQKYQIRRIDTRLQRFETRLAEFVSNCAAGKQPSQVGVLLHRDDSIENIMTKSDKDERLI
ncbi:MAG: hypothetical protein KAG93_03700 [Desulfuromusa sp.]|nr:hypothetical protein [Desulfuromusa sp.]